MSSYEHAQPVEGAMADQLQSRPRPVDRFVWIGRLLHPRNLSLWGVLLLLLTVGMWLLQNYMEGAADRRVLNSLVHPGVHQFQHGVEEQVTRAYVLILTHDADGQLRRTVADKAAFSDYTRQRVERLDGAHRDLLLRASQRLQLGHRKVIEPMHARVDMFADWYYAYRTTYTLLWKASTFAVDRAVAIASPVSMVEGVSLDMQRYLGGQFSARVMKPESSDPLLQSYYQDTLEFAYQHYLSVMAAEEAGFQLFLATQTTHYEGIDPQQIAMTIDWQSQIYNVDMSGHQKDGMGALAGGAIIVGLGMAGKGGAKTISKGPLPAQLQTLASRMSSPLISKIVNISGVGLSGSLAGPIGITVGVSLGLLIDGLINAGVELASRDDMERDAHRVLTTFNNELDRSGTASVTQAVDIWFKDTQQLLLQYDHSPTSEIMDR